MEDFCRDSNKFKNRPCLASAGKLARGFEPSKPIFTARTKAEASILRTSWSTLRRASLRHSPQICFGNLALTLELNRSFDRLANLLGLKAQIASVEWAP
jgi:hypothetical protein